MKRIAMALAAAKSVAARIAAGWKALPDIVRVLAILALCALVFTGWALFAIPGTGS